MDSVWVVLIPLPFAKMGPFYQVDPEADVLVIVPPREQQFAPWGDADVDEVHGTEDALSQSGLRIKVSSKHLILASNIFKNKLRHFSRNTSVRPDGRIHLSFAQGFDPRAAAIVLNAVHGKSFKIPKAVDVETLAQIALFADKFQLVEAVSVYADRWVSKLQSQLPGVCNRELVLWIYISHVFHQAEVFKAATKVAAVYSAAPIKSLGLPLSERIIRDLDNRRQELIAESVTIVYNVLDSLSNGTITCAEFHCDSLLLGNLVKILSKNGLLWPRAAKPFAGVSYVTIVKSVGPFLQHRRRDYGQGGDSFGAQVSQVVNRPVNHANGVNGANGVHRTPYKKLNGLAGEPPSSLPSHSLELHAIGEFEAHECDARRFVASFGQLNALADGVVGLELETALGYQIY